MAECRIKPNVRPLRRSSWRPWCVHSQPATGPVWEQKPSPGDCRSSRASIAARVIEFYSSSRATVTLFRPTSRPFIGRLRVCRSTNVIDCLGRIRRVEQTCQKGDGRFSVCYTTVLEGCTVPALLALMKRFRADPPDTKVYSRFSAATFCLRLSRRP